MLLLLLCGNALESLANVLSRCSALIQNKCEAKAYWNVPVFVERDHLNRVDARLNNYKEEKDIG